MSKRRLDFSYFLLFWCLNGVIGDYRDYRDYLEEFKRESKTPIFALRFNKDMETSETTEDLTPHVQPLQPPYDRKAYLLYHILRTTQETEEIDTEAAKKLEETENILKETLRKRCATLDICVKQCPPKKKFTCKLTCQEEHDDYDVCNRPKKNCNAPKCGVTKPPYWKMLRLKFLSK